jgi:hypothetical protein
MTPLEREFTKFLKHLRLEKEWYTIKPLNKEDLDSYGDLVIDGIDFNGYRIIKYKHKYEYKTLAEAHFREGYVHEVYVTINIPGTREEPPDQDEQYLFGYEHSSKTFLEILNHMNEERLNDALMCDDMVALYPYVVNYTWKDEKGQFPCEAEDEDHALEQCSDAYPECEIEKILKQGED